MGTITLTPESDYTTLFSMPVGTVIRVKGGYETVLTRIKEATPPNKEFVLTPITAGTSLFTTYGPNHLIVSQNNII